jgi:hypothetical protein
MHSSYICQWHDLECRKTCEVFGNGKEIKMDEAIRDEKRLNQYDTDSRIYQLEQRLLIAREALIEIANMNADSAVSGEMKATARMTLKFLKKEQDTP